MVEIPVPLDIGVLAVALHLGVSAGWHVGKAMTRYNAQRKDKSRGELLKQFFWKATHHYDSGIALVLGGFILILGLPPLKQLTGVMLIGFGSGMAYDDRADHPDMGVLRYIFGRIRKTGMSKGSKSAGKDTSRLAPHPEGEKPPADDTD